GCDHGHLVEEFLSASLAAQAVDGSIAGSGCDPGAWVGRKAVACPCTQGDGKRLLHCVLGEVDVAEGADQGGDRSAGLLAEDPADRGLVEPGYGVNVVQSVSPRIRVGTGGPRSASRLLRWSSTPRRAPRRGRWPR